MDTNEALRKRARRLIAHGVSQKTIAAKMGISAPRFNKWFNGAKGATPVPVTALDGLDAFEKELATLHDDEDEGTPPTEKKGEQRPAGSKRRHAG